MFTVSAIKYDKVSGASLSILREWHYSQLEWHYSQLEWHYSQLRFQNNPLPGCWEDSQPLQTYQNQLGHPNNAVNPIRNHPQLRFTVGYAPLLGRCVTTVSIENSKKNNVTSLDLPSSHRSTARGTCILQGTYLQRHQER